MGGAVHGGGGEVGENLSLIHPGGVRQIEPRVRDFVALPWVSRSKKEDRLQRSRTKGAQRSPWLRRSDQTNLCPTPDGVDVMGEFHVPGYAGLTAHANPGLWMLDP